MKSLTHGISGNVQEGYNTRREAENAYACAYSLGIVRALPAPGSQGAVALATPMSPAVMNIFKDADDEFLGAEWYVVFKGLTPGIFPTWYVLCEQLREQIFTVGIGILRRRKSSKSKARCIIAMNANKTRSMHLTKLYLMGWLKL